MAEAVDALRQWPKRVTINGPDGRLMTEERAELADAGPHAVITVRAGALDA